MLPELYVAVSGMHITFLGFFSDQQATSDSNEKVMTQAFSVQRDKIMCQNSLQSSTPLTPVHKIFDNLSLLSESNLSSLSKSNSYDPTILGSDDCCMLGSDDDCKFGYDKG